MNLDKMSNKKRNKIRENEQTRKFQFDRKAQLERKYQRELRKIRPAEDGDANRSHIEANAILLELLIELGYESVVNTYKNIGDKLGFELYRPLP
jgi:hypothetical protein